VSKILIIANVHSILKETLESNGHDIDVKLDIDREELLEIVNEYHGLVVRSSHLIDRVLIDRASELKFIARAGSGMELIDTEYATSIGIKCLNSPEGNAESVAEHVIGMMLGLLHNIRRADFQMRDGSWNREENRGSELKYKTVGVLGAGNTGSALIEKLSGFKCEVIAHDLIPEKVDIKYARSVSLDELKEKSDIVSVHIPLESENAHFINKSFIESCSKPIYLINASRGGVLNTIEIIDCLKVKKILGLGLDVFENEKPETFAKQEKSYFMELMQMENVILTPHIGGWSHESEYKIAQFLVKKILNSA